jgi:hypothetical protein
MATRTTPPPTDRTYRGDEWLTLGESAGVMKSSYWTVSRMAARGEFCPKAVKLPNGRWRVRYDDLMSWISRLGS